MEQIPTAEEFFEQGGTYPELAIEFAKLHVEAALKAVTNKRKEIHSKPGGYIINDEDILQSYPLENIK